MDINEEEFMKSMLDRLENTGWDDYMNLCYNVIVMFPDQIMNHESNGKNKITSLGKILLHFEEKEDYEKCKKLKDIQDMLNC